MIHKPVEYWEKVLAVNLNGVMLTNRAVARVMLAQGEGGSIVNISSGAAKAPIRGMADYCVSKAGVWMMTRCIALELAPSGIRVNTVAPGLIDTPMTLAVTTDEERKQRRIEGIPLNRLGEPATSPRRPCSCSATRPATSPDRSCIPTEASSSAARARSEPRSCGSCRAAGEFWVDRADLLLRAGDSRLDC